MNRAAPVLALLLASSTGCSSSPWKRTPPPLYATPRLVLFREALEKDGARVPLGYRHPVRIEREEVANILRQLVFRQDKLLSTRKLELFTNAELEEIAEPIALALGQVTPDERLRFLVVRSSWKDAIFGPEGTSGVVFVKEDGVLELAFDALLERVNLPDSNEPMKIRFPTDPTELTDGSPILTPVGMRLKPRPGQEPHPRWLEVRRGEVARVEAPAPVVPAPAGVVPTPTAPAAPPPPAVTPSRPTPPVASGQGSPAPQAPPPNPGEAGVAGGAAAPPTTPPPDARKEAEYQALRARLETLQRLRKDGVLSEEEYRVEFEKVMGAMGK